MNSLLAELASQLQPRPNPNLTAIQFAEAEKKRVTAAYTDFYKKYGGRKALSTFLVDNVSEVYGQSNFRLDVVPKGDRLSETGMMYRGSRGGTPSCHPYVGLSSGTYPVKG